jgi:exonuclease SbcC
VIKRLDVTNYQSHPDTSLDFHQGVNVIIGKSNEGKTSLIRALMWLAENRPLGFRFHTRGTAGTTKVEVETLEGIVALAKSEKSSEYVLGQERWPTPGGSVPDQVSQLLNLTEINVQRQFDAHFLICSPPGEVARVINQVTHIEQTDEWISKTTSEINEANREIRILQGDLKETEDKLRPLEEMHLDDLKRDLEKVQDMRGRVGELENSCERIEEILRRSGVVVGEIIKGTQVLEVLSPQLEDLLLCYGDLRKLDQERTLLDKLLRVQDEACSLDGFVKEAEPAVKDVVMVAEDLRALVKDGKSIGSALECYNGLSDRKEQDRKFLAIAEQDLKELLLKEGRCPLCLSELNSDQIKSIMG